MEEKQKGITIVIISTHFELLTKTKQKQVARERYKIFWSFAIIFREWFRFRGGLKFRGWFIFMVGVSMFLGVIQFYWEWFSCEGEISVCLEYENNTLWSKASEVMKCMAMITSATKEIMILLLVPDLMTVWKEIVKKYNYFQQMPSSKVINSCKYFKHHAVLFKIPGNVVTNIHEFTSDHRCISYHK